MHYILSNTFTEYGCIYFIKMVIRFEKVLVSF